MEDLTGLPRGGNPVGGGGGGEVPWESSLVPIRRQVSLLNLFLLTTDRAEKKAVHIEFYSFIFFIFSRHF